MIARQGGTEGIQRLGKMICEAVENTSSNRIKEKWGSIVSNVRETASMGDQTNLYTDMIASFIEAAFLPELLAQGVINEITLNVKGSGSIKIPKDAILTAQDVDEHGAFTESQEGYTSTTIALKWIAARTGLPIPLIRVAAVDLVSHRLGQIGNALAVKVDTDIVEELIKSGTKDDGTYGDNENYNYLTAGQYINYDRLINAISGHKNKNAEPDAILMNPVSWATLMKDAEVKGAIQYSISADGKVIFVENFGGLKILVSSQITTNKIILVDTEKCGYFLRGSGIETWDGREDNTIRIEVVGAMSYGVGIVRPEAVWVIHEDMNEP